MKFERNAKSLDTKTFYFCVLLFQNKNPHIIKWRNSKIKKNEVCYSETVARKHRKVWYLHQMF